jgi:hypothetical protein
VLLGLQQELVGAILHPSLLIDQLGIVLIPPQNEDCVLSVTIALKKTTVIPTKHWTIPESADLLVLPTVEVIRIRHHRNYISHRTSSSGR